MCAVEGAEAEGGSEMKINGPDVATTRARGTCYFTCRYFFCPFILPWWIPVSFMFPVAARAADFSKRSISSW